MKRRDLPIWVLPGGGVDPGEDPATAAVREVMEESSCEARVTHHIASYSPPIFSDTQTVLYRCEYLKGTPTPSDESEEAAFFPIDRLPEPTFVLHRYWLQEAMDCPPAPIRASVTLMRYPRIIPWALRHFYLVFRYLFYQVKLPSSPKRR